MRNLLASFYFFVARGICSIIQLRILSGHFGAQFSGLNALLNQVYLYVTLFELGLAASAISLLYQPLQAKDHKRVSELITALHRDSVRLTLFATPIVFVALALYARAMHTSLPFSAVFGSLALTAASGLISLLTLSYQSYLNAAENIFQVHAVLGTSFIVKTTLGLLLALKTGNYLFLPLSNVSLSLVELAILRLLFRRHFPTHRPLLNKAVESEVRSRARFALCHKVSGLIYYQSDFVILSMAASLSSVNTYAKYQYISAGILGIVGAAFTAVTASLARRHIAADKQGQQNQYSSIATACYLAGFLFLLAYVFTANTCVGTLYGSASLQWPVLMLFAVQLFLNVIKTVDDTFIAAKGAFQVAVYLPLVEPVAYIAIALPLVHYFGFRGILAAAIAINLTFAVIGKCFVVAKAVLSIRFWALALVKLRCLAFAASLATPLVLSYLFFTQRPSPVWMSLVLPNLLGALYVAPLCYWLVHRVPHAPIALSPSKLTEERAA